ncbi:thiosulfate sulfurtransferase-like isoform X2 [Gigantopelta aegis]|uniref:thiosulfate sulfurtransferase-like isoform X2 n=1 Tax=Gigantopelta aegis TaxID=1735272 RepID=UPI001B88C223|nr:thiosulfate sulfurtransferase-like isoform X2 [Gigantopelta aegis]
MSPEMPGLLVSCEWLKNALDNNTPDLVVVDVTWASTKNCREDYDKEHIPGAVFINVMDAEHTNLFPRNIPTLESFGKFARAVGINRDSHVIIYSNSHTCGFFCSGRGWWSFRIFGHSNVSVLNGGLAKWKSHGYPTTDAISTVKEDSPGHIVGAYNIPFASLVNVERMEFKSVDELKEVFSEAGVDVNKPVVGHCNSGMSSCNTVLAALLCGSPRAALYHGGFTEWKKRVPDLIEK